MKRLILCFLVLLSLSACDSSVDEKKMVENYIRDNIADINPVEPVLGGQWYVVDLNFEEENVMVEAEDGHIVSEFKAKYEVEEGEVLLSEIEEMGDESFLFHPIDNFESAGTLKPFGIFVSPEESPVSPERFRGYHTGIDVEVPDNEKDVWVYAISDCEKLLSKVASGYGGVIVLGCEIKGEDYTVLYGHLDIASIEDKNLYEAGEMIATLGDGYSAETDGERKHLHFAIHKGSAVELKGYVMDELEISNWVDPLELYSNL